MSLDYLCQTLVVKLDYGQSCLDKLYIGRERLNTPTNIRQAEQKFILFVAYIHSVVTPKLFKVYAYS